jgi:hypothetical protein
MTTPGLRSATIAKLLSYPLESAVGPEGDRAYSGDKLKFGYRCRHSRVPNDKIIVFYTAFGAMPQRAISVGTRLSLWRA